jgi:hypothetical protein
VDVSAIGRIYDSARHPAAARLDVPVSRVIVHALLPVSVRTIIFSPPLWIFALPRLRFPDPGFPKCQRRLSKRQPTLGL